ncbi:hypothetical protein GOP47_0010353 [Adiantum capillus-veneris]|uniref:Transcriptional adapter n=1 Tax=Adiantum capillus-veneris TaxID=13818 RepID=A0A9D4ZHP5_ADICA|nr:hypothetical protein GOP47_0010353 [Adiantum capillus-veneris]
MGRYRAPASGAEDSRSKRRRPGHSADLGASGSHEAKKSLYHCNYCNKDISGVIRIRCAKCLDFDLCLECFSIGAEVSPHKANHPYRVIENLSFSLIHPDWTADEEMLLLEGVETHGLGDWVKVAVHVATKTKLQCYNHYMSSYMNSPCSPLPDLTNIRSKTRAELMAITKAHQKGGINDGIVLKPPKQEPSVSPTRVKMEERDAVRDGRSPSSISVGSVTEGEKGQDRAYESKSLTATNPATVVDKKPVLPGQQKEGSESTATVAEGDGGQSNRSIGVKKPKPLFDGTEDGTTYLDQSGFNPKRREFDKEYDNDAELPLAEMEFKEADTETDYELKLRMLHIYLERLDERKRRKDFILERGLLDVKRQQELDNQRSDEERKLYQQARVFLRYHTSEEHEALLAGLCTEQRTRQYISELQECWAAGCHSLTEAEQYKSEKSRQEASTRRAKDGSVQAPTGKELQRSSKISIKEGIDSDMNPSTGLGSYATTFDISGLPGTNLLSSAEQQFCCKTKIFPASYLKMKEVLMLESIKNGSLKRSDGQQLLRSFPSKVDAVFDLLLQMGWIQSDDVPLSVK